MCLTFCHRLYQEQGEAVLFWNHNSCHPDACAYAPGQFPSIWRCGDCRHQVEGKCGLTGAPQPIAGGCCHYNVAVVTGEVAVDRMLDEPWRGVTVAEVLDYMGVSYRQLEGRTLVDLAELAHAVPVTYGRGVEERDEELPELRDTVYAPDEMVPAPSAGLRWWE